jgi:signal transduction histidine kinase
MLLFDGACDDSAAAEARAMLRGLRDAGRLTPDGMDDIALAVSELMTNALNAGASTVRAVLETLPAHIRLEVTDDAAGIPVAGHPQLLDTAGRGLRIVAALARQWGYHSAADGKTVWAEFAD